MSTETIIEGWGGLMAEALACLALLVALSAFLISREAVKETRQALDELAEALDAIALASMPPDAMFVSEDGEEAEFRFDRSN